MSIQLGVSREKKAKLKTTNFGDFVTLGEDGKYVHRVVGGSEEVQTVFYPTVAEDQDSGEARQTYRTVIRPPDGCVLDALAELDRKIQRSGGQKNPGSALTPQKRHWYLVIVRGEDPKVRIAQYPPSVSNRLIELEEMEHVKGVDRTGMLQYGPMYAWDAIIERKKDPAKRGRFATTYTVEVGTFDLIGKIPIEALDTGLDFGVEKTRKLIFSDEDWKAIKACDLELEKSASPDSEETILDRLERFPLDILSVRNGSPIFTDPNAIETLAKELGVPIVRGLSGPSKVSTPEPSSTEGVVLGESKEEVPEKPAEKPSELSKDPDPKPESGVILNKVKEGVAEVTESNNDDKDKKEKEAPEVSLGSGGMGKKLAKW